MSNRLNYIPESVSSRVASVSAVLLSNQSLLQLGVAAMVDGRAFTFSPVGSHCRHSSIARHSGGIRT